MKIITLIFIFAGSFLCYAQEELNIHLADTLKFKLEDKKVNYMGFEGNVINPNNFKYSEMDFLKLRTRLNQTAELNEVKPFIMVEAKSILSPLYQKYMEEQKYSVLNYILGTIQAGAVGYLAYKHIEKYGFFGK